MSEEHKKKISLALMGNHNFPDKWTDERREKFIITRKGHTVSQETREKLRQWNKKNKKNWMYDQQGGKNRLWKGNNAGYQAIHTWIRKHWGTPSKCEFCETIIGKFEWARKNDLLVRERKEWLRLCIKCHRKYDDSINKSWVKRHEKMRLKNGQ